jgi:hypothetical protein
MVITFLSDFGLEDDFVGTCHGVIKGIAPEADVIDITHGIEPQSILQGALVLANTLPYMPEGVHLAVVDPDVGTPRRALALRSGAMSSRPLPRTSRWASIPPSSATPWTPRHWFARRFPAPRLESGASERPASTSTGSETFS